MKISHLNGLRAFEATLRTGSFRAAAAELGVTPAAVGQQVRALEDFLGQPLFDRGNARAVPTSQARAVQARLTEGFGALHDALAQLRAHRHANRIAVTLPASFAENWFTRHIGEFYRDNAEIDLRLDASNRRVDLRGEGFDFAIRYCPPPGDEYDSTDLFGDHVLPVCTPEFARRHTLRPESQSLRGVPLVHLGKRTPDPDWPDWPDWCAAHAVEPAEGGVHYQRFSSGLQAALSGQGLVLCGVTEAFAALDEGRLVMPFGPGMASRTGYAYRLLSLPGAGMTPLQRRFRRWVGETAAAFRDEVEALLSRA